MHDTALKCCIGVILGSLAVVLALSAWTGREPKAGPPDPMAVPKVSPVRASMSPVAEAERGAVSQSPVCLIKATGINGVGIPACQVAAWPSVQKLPPPVSEVLASTDANGLASLATNAISDHRHLVVWKHGYVPVMVARVEAPADRPVSEDYQVIMRTAASCGISVITEAGEPVVGMSVVASPVDCAAAAPTPPGTRDLLFPPLAEGQIVAAVGRTGSDGVVILDHLSPGRHLLRCNTERLPYYILDATSFLCCDAPGSVSLIVKELWGAVVLFTGDEVVLSDMAPLRESPFEFSSDMVNVAAMNAARRDLSVLHKGALVIVGALAKNRLPSADIHVFGRTSGWSKHSVTLVPVRDLRSPTSVDIPLGESDKTAVVSATLEIDGKPVEYEGAGVAFCWLREGTVVWRRAQPGERIRVPAGEFRVSPAGELDPDAFAQVVSTVQSGADEVVRISIARALRRYGIDVRLPGGGVPTEFGLSMRFKNNNNNFKNNNNKTPAGRRSSAMINVEGGRYTFLSAADEQEFTAYVKGFKGTKGRVKHGSGRAEGSLEVFLVEVTEVLGK